MVWHQLVSIVFLLTVDSASFQETAHIESRVNPGEVLRQVVREVTDRYLALRAGGAVVTNNDCVCNGLEM